VVLIIVLSKGVQVTLAGSIINFSLGIFYAWSVFADGLIKELGWSKAEAMLPYTMELLFFSIAMIFGGRFQDRFGPRRGIRLSGIFTGLAFIACGLTANPIGVAFSFGFVFAVAAAFGYSAVTPAAIKWFPPAKRGLVTGLVLMSLGAGSLLWAPVINFMLDYTGVVNAFIISGIIIMTAITVSSHFISIPDKTAWNNNLSKHTRTPVDFDWRKTIKEPSFKILWALVGLTSGVGMMFIGHLVQIADTNFQVEWGYVLVSIFAFTNASSRLIGGAICDRLGYIGNMKVALMMMVAAMLLYISGLGWPALVLGTTFLGLSYGSLYTSYPNAVAELFGIENFGIAYGLIFTALGIVGSLGPMVSAFLVEVTASYNFSFLIGLTATLLCFFLVAKLKQLISQTSCPDL